MWGQLYDAGKPASQTLPNSGGLRYGGVQPATVLSSPSRTPDAEVSIASPRTSATNEQPPAHPTGTASPTSDAAETAQGINGPARQTLTVRITQRAPARRGQPATFDVTVSTPVAGYGLPITLDFGDGTIKDDPEPREKCPGTEEGPSTRTYSYTHTYAEPGEYTVHLIARADCTDEWGVGEDTHVVAVADADVPASTV